MPLCSSLTCCCGIKKRGANNGAATALVDFNWNQGLILFQYSYALLKSDSYIARPVAAFFMAMIAGHNRKSFSFKEKKIIFSIQLPLLIPLSTIILQP